MPPLREGLGERFAWRISTLGIAAWGAGLAVASALLAALIVVPAIAVYWRRRLGGITSDCLGASVEVTESLLLLAAAAAVAR